jgi:predicted ATPase
MQTRGEMTIMKVALYRAPKPEKSRATGKNMKRFIITGAPGAGKTAIIRHLELDGFGVVEEAATDIIAVAHARGTREPWTDPAFLDAIALLQRERVIRGASLPDEIQFHDRSIVCTAALAAYLGHSLSPFLTSELERIRRECVYQPQVFFIQNLGHITLTAARRITFEESLEFEKVHEDTYRNLGFELLYIAPGEVTERVRSIRAAVEKAKDDSCS